jgi:arylsulfatase A-like enzyme
MRWGRILDALDAAGLAEDTVVVFTSDHGDFLGDHGHLRKGIGATQSLIHTPLVVRAPGSELPARVSTPASNCDVLPTVASLAGLPAPTGIDGVDLTAVVRDGLPHTAKVFSGAGSHESVNHSVVDDRYRFTWYPALDSCELFDHLEDPGECRNIADHAGQRERVAACRADIAATLAASHNPMLGRISAW